MNKIVLFSDTHGFHKHVKVPECDIAIHAGDVCSEGKIKDLAVFLNWFRVQPAKHKILVAGNHDWPFERARDIAELLCKDNGIIYLNASEVEVEGLKVWGSPMQPVFCFLAFNRSSKFLKEHWKLIPEDIDILVTHVPPHSILDKTFDGLKVGCSHLKKRIEEIAPKIHVFGHIHEAHGIFDSGTTVSYNASIVDVNFKPVNKPFIISIS